MATVLEEYRKKVFDKWWSMEIEPKIAGLSRELRAKLEKFKEGFVLHHVTHDEFDDFCLKRESITELQKEFDDFFDTIGKSFLHKIVKFYLNIGKP